MMTLDEAIREAYTQLGVPADQLLLEPELAEQFIDAVNTRLHHPVSADRIKRRLLTLRKRGQGNGGLPRLERSYRGRSVRR